MPFAERASCILRAPGIAALKSAEKMVSTRCNTINGGLLALAAEEAVRSLYEGQALCSLALRYVRPCRVGPAVAVAERHGSLGTVEIKTRAAEGGSQSSAAREFVSARPQLGGAAILHRCSAGPALERAVKAGFIGEAKLLCGLRNGAPLVEQRALRETRQRVRR